MMTRRAGSRRLSALVALLMVALFAVVGFRVGQIVRPSAADAASTWQSAASASFSKAKTNEYGLAWKQGYARGWQAGRSAGEAAGTEAGQAAGQLVSARRSLAAQAVAEALASTPRRLSHSIRTSACVPVPGGLCEVLGPRVTGKPCPPGTLPYAEGGAVCIPRLLLAVAQTAK